MHQADAIKYLQDLDKLYYFIFSNIMRFIGLRESLQNKQSTHKLTRRSGTVKSLDYMIDILSDIFRQLVLAGCDKLRNGDWDEFVNSDRHHASFVRA